MSAYIKYGNISMQLSQCDSATAVPRWAYLRAGLCIWICTQGSVVERMKRLIEPGFVWTRKGQGMSSEKECGWWEKLFGWLYCLLPSNDEGKACAVFFLPGLSSSLPLASSISVKSQAPMLDCMFFEAKQSNVLQLKKNKFQSESRISQPSVLSCQWFSLYSLLCQANAANK